MGAFRGGPWVYGWMNGWLTGGRRLVARVPPPASFSLMVFAD